MPNNLNISDSKYIFNIKTVQSGAVRILVEALKEILTDGKSRSRYNSLAPQQL